MGKNILLTIAYDGSRFHGWQKQPGAFTVQGHLEKTMSHLFKREILLSGTSRTDAGVHALDQKASFVTDVNVPIDKLPLVINNALCGEEDGPFAKAPVRILDAQEMPARIRSRRPHRMLKLYRRSRRPAKSRERLLMQVSRQLSPRRKRQLPRSSNMRAARDGMLPITARTSK